MARLSASWLVVVLVGLGGTALAADPAPAPAPAPAPVAAPAPAQYPPGYPQGYPVYTYPPGYGQVPAGYPQAAPYVAVPAPAPVEAAPTPLPPSCKAVVFGTPKEVEKVMGELYATGRNQFAFFGNGVVCGWK